ncbi:MAG TPA: DUF6152 family protein [Vicinamibacterales bacterium]|nr:DUF6152 family protein [Vicinamibacterales bacterium]
MRHLILTIALVLATTLVSAHHSWPVNMDKLVTVKGTITRVEWANPHPMFTLEVRDNGSKIETWQIGGPAVTRMEANGWTKTTLKPGDTVTGVGYQFSDGQKILRLEKIVLADGKELAVYARR